MMLCLVGRSWLLQIILGNTYIQHIHYTELHYKKQQQQLSLHHKFAVLLTHFQFMVVPQATSEVKLLARSASHDVLQQPDPSFFQEVLGTRLVSSKIQIVFTALFPLLANLLLKMVHSIESSQCKEVGISSLEVTLNKATILSTHVAI